MSKRRSPAPPSKKKASKKSGGKRAVEKKHRERKAARNRSGDHQARWLADVEALGVAPSAEKGHSWLGRAALLIVQATLRDVGLPPEQMRRDAMRQIEQAAKVMDPAKLSEQLEELERSLEELRKHARNIEAGKGRTSSSRADLI